MRSLFVPELMVGLAGGTAAAILMWLALPTWRRTGRSGPLPAAGLAIVGTAVLAIAVQRAVPGGVLVGVAGVAGACAVPGRSRWAPLALLVAAPFAWLIALESSTTPWVQLLTFLVAWLGAVAASRTEPSWGVDAVTSALLATTAAGVFLGVPDTEEAAALLGATVPFVLLGWPLRLVTLGRPGTAGTVALVVWVAAVGGRGSPASIVGGLACLGLLVGLAIGGVVRTALVSRTRSFPPAPVPAVLAIHVAVVVVASRVASTSGELRVAVPVALATSIAAVAAGALLCPRRAATPTS